MFKLGRERRSLNIFSGVPAESIFGGLRSVPVCFGVHTSAPHTRSGYECAERRHSNAERESLLLNIWGRAYFVQFLNIGDVFDLFNF